MRKETIQEAIGKFIYNERKKQKMSLTALSIKIYNNKCSATRIGNIEKGTFRNVSVNTISGIFTALGYDLREIFKE
ncbi:MAG TPA: helix-turn-helix transcriptional regulator [Flavobacterium sp.]